MRRLDELSNHINGQVTAHPEMKITGAASISRAGSNDITFVTSAKHFQDFLQCEAGAAVVSMDQETGDKPCIRVNDVESAFTEIAKLFKPPVARAKIGISSQAIVSPTARISEDVCIHPGAVVMDNVEIGCGTVIYPNVTVMENCVIGANVKIFPNSVLYENTIVGDRAILHAGTVLGAYGFGYKHVAGQHVLCPQIGNVVIEDDVEIGASTTIDRSTYDSTVIGKGTKIDNLVMIGHNCIVGENNLLCSQVGIAGTCTTGNYVVMGGQVGIGDHLNIGNNVSIAAKSGLMHDIEDGQKFFGIPARPHREEMQYLIHKSKLPEMRKTIKRLEKRVDELNQADSANENRAA